jgi:hypothetical protein
VNGVPSVPASRPLESDPLAALRDWHLPDPVSWWPPAPGWWLVAGLVLALMVIALRWWRAYRRRTAPARTALAELAVLRSRLTESGDGRSFGAGVSVLLRRLALARYPRDQVAGLAGPRWLAFLDRTGGAGAFTQGPGQVLVEAPYRPDRGSGTARGEGVAPGREPAGLAELAERWIRAHGEPRP